LQQNHQGGTHGYRQDVGRRRSRCRCIRRTRDAQESLAPKSRQELKRADLTGTNMEVIISVIENQPGETIARHIHHGAEVFYVLQGATLETAVRRADHSAGRRKRHQSP
jgi:hypothetical protein